MISITEKYNEREKALQKSLADAVVENGLPVAALRKEGNEFTTLLVQQNGVLADTADMARDLGYCGKPVHALPISELAYILDFGSTDAEDIEDIVG